MDSPEVRHQRSKSSKKSLWGCVLGGCLGSLLLAIVLVIGGGVGMYYLASSQLKKYTADAPRGLPVVESSPESLEQLSRRAENFKESLQSDQTPQPFHISANEINSAISQVKDMRGKVFIRLEDGKIYADVSLNLDQLPGGANRFFNGTLVVTAKIEQEVLVVHVVDGQVNDQPIPENVIAPFRSINLAKDLSQVPELAEALKGVEDIIVDDGQITFTPRPR